MVVSSSLENHRPVLLGVLGSDYILLWICGSWRDSFSICMGRAIAVDSKKRKSFETLDMPRWSWRVVASKLGLGW